MHNDVHSNPLYYEKIYKLLLKFATPSIISMLVGALYNIVDQIFIGQGVGINGNAATNVAFPLTTICVSISLFLGLGGASSYSLLLGRGEREKASTLIGNTISKGENISRKIFKDKEYIGGMVLSIFVVSMSFIIPFSILKVLGSFNVYLKIAVESIFIYQIQIIH